MRKLSRLQGYLSTNRPLRFSVVSLLYLAQGITMGIMTIALPAYLAENGLSPKEIGLFIGTILLPWSLKIVAAPIMDKYTYWAMGRRRPWMILAIAGSGMAYLSALFVEINLPDLYILLVICTIISAFTAIMDVSVDGLAVDVFPEKEQSGANGFMWGSKVAGSALSASICIMLMNEHGIRFCFAVVGVILILFVLIPLLIREREGERILPWARGERSAHSLSIEPGSAYVVLRELLLGIVNKKRFLAILIIFTNGLALGYFDAMMPVFTVQELHWESKEYSEIASIAGLCAGALGILLSGVIMNRLGSGKTINIFILCMILIPVLLLSARTFWYTHELIFAFIILILIVRTLALIAIFALCMSLCSKLISATHFALFTAFGNLGISSGSGLFGHFSESYTYVGLLVIYAGISIITLFTSLIYHKEKVRPELIIEPS